MAWIKLWACREIRNAIRAQVRTGGERIPSESLTPAYSSYVLFQTRTRTQVPPAPQTCKRLWARALHLAFYSYTGFPCAGSQGEQSGVESGVRKSSSPVPYDILWFRGGALTPGLLGCQAPFADAPKRSTLSRERPPLNLAFLHSRCCARARKGNRAGSNQGFVNLRRLFPTTCCGLGWGLLTDRPQRPERRRGVARRILVQ